MSARRSTSLDARLGSPANARDVGAAAPGLRRGVVWRSDAPFTGDAAPLGLDPWPPTTVLDLRDPGESRGRHALAETSTVHALPVLADAALAGSRPGMSLLDLYEVMLSGASARMLARVVTAVAAEPGPVLVHCSAGKDRTGVSVALVLSLVGVDRDRIVTDYLATAARMPGVVARMAAAWGEASRGVDVARIPPAMLETPRGAIEAVLDAWEALDGGAEEWFAASGGDPAAVAALRGRLLV